MRTIALPSELSSFYAKALAFQAEPGERFFALVESTVTRTPERTIAVRVLDTGGQALAGIRVTQEWPDGHESLETGADGEAVFFLGPGSRFVPPRGGPHRVYVG